MLIISHRGNLEGVDHDKENSPDQIEQCLSLEFDVEIDVWEIGGELFLGHDKPQYTVEESFLSTRGLWCHAKNKEAMVRLANTGAHYFWHEEDRYTITNRGIIWCYPENYHPNGVVVVRGKNSPMGTVKGICTDYPLHFKSLMKKTL